MKTKIGSLAAAACAAALFAVADAAVAGYTPEGVATVDWIDSRHGNAVIGDRTFALSPGVVIHGPYGLSPRASLREGMNVRFRAVPGSPPAVVEIWIVK